MKPMTAERIVHVVDDDRDVRGSLEQLLLSVGFTPVLYPTPFAVLDVAAGLKSGCVLIDVRMPRMDGLTLLKRLSKLGVMAPVIIMTGHGDTRIAVECMKAGAVDFIEKPFEKERLTDALNAALKHSWRADRWSDVIVATQRIGRLSKREREVLDGLVLGHSNKAIANHLGISVRTVEAHRARMLTRLGAHQLAEAIRLAVMASLAGTGR